MEMFLICARADCLAKNVEVFSSMYALANEVGSEVYEYCASPISLSRILCVNQVAAYAELACQRRALVGSCC